MDAVDDVISVQDFLSVVENHILEDVKTCCKAMQAKDSRTVGDNSRAIYQRSGRLCDVVAAEMDRYHMISYITLRYCTIRYDTAWYGTIWHNTVQYSAMWTGTSQDSTRRR